MKLRCAILLLIWASVANDVAGFTARYGSKRSCASVPSALNVEKAEAQHDVLISSRDVSKLSFRELQKECKTRGLEAVGTTGILRRRLVESIIHSASENENRAEKVNESGSVDEQSKTEQIVDGISFHDKVDPDYEYNSALSQIISKARVGHWKAATRKLKTLQRRHSSEERPFPEEAYVEVLRACTEDRLHGARASEPARKILEELSDAGNEIPADLGNSCVVNCLGLGPNGTHDGFGGIDTALAMLAALENSATVVTMDTYSAVVSALSRDGAVEEGILLIRAMVVERSFTPTLSTFSDLAKAAANSKSDGHAELVMQVLSLVKAAGYELDSIASAEAGRSLLASGVIAAEKMENIALGLRLLTAAQKAEGCDPDRGDTLVASSSTAAQRASTLIHKRAIDKATQDSSWKLAVRLLELMPQRSLTPSTAVWRKVVTVCAKNEKSRKATALLLDWVKLANEGNVEKPPLSVFNLVVNACEICGEEELTLVVLESMRRTHETDGNIITFNIALKRLAKLGQTKACEGIIIGMLQAGIEPTVVSYTTAIGACVRDKDSAFAYEWLKRMRTRNISPNLYSYNTALAACLDGKLESTKLGSIIATEMMSDVDKQLASGVPDMDESNSAIPNSYTKVLARNLMKQLRENWRNGDIDMAVAKATLRVPLLRLVDFDKSEEAEKVKKELTEKLEERMKKIMDCGEEEDVDGCVVDELELEYSDVSTLHKEGARVAEV